MLLKGDKDRFALKRGLNSITEKGPYFILIIITTETKKGKKN